MSRIPSHHSNKIAREQRYTKSMQTCTVDKKMACTSKQSRARRGAWSRVAPSLSSRLTQIAVLDINGALTALATP